MTKIFDRKTGKEINIYDLALKMYKAGSEIVYCDIECVLEDKETGAIYILDECGTWDYIDKEKYRISI